jgi:tRNA(fMet)-specific endonuclease VapC
VAARPDQTRGILDTSTLLLLGRLDDPAALPDQPAITAITLAELAVGPLVAREPAEQARRQAHLQQAEADFVPLPFDAAAARAFAGVALSLRATGRKAATRRYDAMIAAIAISTGQLLYTCNPRDFDGIEGLDLVAVTLPRAAAGEVEEPTTG